MNRRLEIFLTITEKNSNQEAADALNMTQPNVSYHLRKLEEELGVKLLELECFNRGGKITEAGKIVAIHAARILNELNSMKACLQTLKRGKSA
jgi:DNA-binding transcriptional LysR family regulator